jgi:hypothetical protein
MNESNTLLEMNNTLKRCEENMNKIIVGLYGSLDEPGTGFIHETNASLSDLKTKVGDLITERTCRKDSNKWTLRMVLGTLFATIITIIKVFFFDRTGN